MTETLRRVFKGKVSNIMTHFEQAELSAYIRGDEKFRFGFHANKEPMYFSVRSKFMKDEEYFKYLQELVN